jgi:hypothetical protein
MLHLSASILLLENGSSNKYSFVEHQEARREPLGPEQLAGGVWQARGGKLADHRHFKPEPSFQ